MQNLFIFDTYSFHSKITITNEKSYLFALNLPQF